jgi:hypothetical protein
MSVNVGSRHSALDYPGVLVRLLTRAEPTLHGFCLHELSAARAFPALAAADGLGLLRCGIRRAN